MAQVSVFDLIFATMMLVNLVALNKVTMGTLKRYMFVPFLLIWVHVVGNGLQEHQIGPEWVQMHLHDLGVATVCLPFVFVIIQTPVILYTDRYQQAIKATDIALKIMLPAHAITTLMCIGYKVSQVTIYREEFVARGYSGNLDIGDVSALIVGFIIMVVNHYALRDFVLSKKNAIIDRASY